MATLLNFNVKSLAHEVFLVRKRLNTSRCTVLKMRLFIVKQVRVQPFKNGRPFKNDRAAKSTRSVFPASVYKHPGVYKRSAKITG